MKKQLLYACFSLLSVTVVAQDKDKKKMLDEQTQLTYSVNTENEKDGSLSIRDLGTKSLWLKGVFKQGRRAGNWYTYSDRKMQLCYNYDQGKLLFIDSALLLKADIRIVTNDKEAAEKARIPLLICPVDLYLTMICRTINLPPDAFKKGLADVKIKAKINESGKATYLVIYEDKSGQKEVPINYKPTPDFTFEWIPARYGKNNLASEYTVTTVLSNTQPADTFRRFRWNY